jgi:DNA-binding beta-propeller fold protein YncE
MNCNTVSTISAIVSPNCHQPEGWTVIAASEFKHGLLNKPMGVAVDGDGNAIVADRGNHRICKITPQGQVSTLAGTGKEGHRDGEGNVSKFSHPNGVAVDGDGNLIVADEYNHCIRKVTPQGQVSTLAGTAGEKGYRNGEGAVAQFHYPCGVAVDGDGNIIVADEYNDRIRKITPQGHVSTLAGTGGVSHRDGEGTVAQFNKPNGVAVDGNGNIIVADSFNNCIRKITQQGHVSTLAGTSFRGHRDGEGTGAHFNWPTGVAVDRDGTVIVTDRDNHCIRKITPQGQVSTLAGTGEKGHEDGDRVSLAQFNQPVGVAVDENGNVIVADMSNNCIRCVASVSNDATSLVFLDLPPLLQSCFVSDIQHHFFDSGSFHDVWFVVEEERIPSHRCLLSARCEYFRSMFGAGFKEGNSDEIYIKDTSSAAFKALLKYLYTDNMEVDDAAVFDLANLCDQYRVDRLYNHCLHQLFEGITVQNAVMRLVQAHTACGEGPMWVNKLKSTTMTYVTRNLKGIRFNAMATLELLERKHSELFKQVLKIKCGFNE